MRILAIIILITLLACNFDQLLNPTFEVQNFLKKQVNKPTIVQYQPTNDTIFQTKRGAKIFIKANTLKDLSGESIVDPIKISISEIFSKSDMIFSDLLPVSYNRVLESGGALKISTTTLENMRTNLTGTIEAFIPLSQTIQNPDSMNLFNLASTLNTGFSNQLGGSDVSNSTWQPLPFGGISLDTVTGVQGFYLQFDGLQSINCDYFYKLNAPKTDIKVIFENNFSAFTSQNCYLVFKDFNSVLRFYKIENDEFIATEVPLDEKALVLGVAIDKNRNFHLGTAEIDIQKNTTISLEMNIVSEDELTNFIKSLD